MVTRFTSTDKRLATDQELLFGDDGEMVIDFDGTTGGINVSGDLRLGNEQADTIALFEGSGMTPGSAPATATGTDADTINDVVAQLTAFGAYTA